MNYGYLGKYLIVNLTSKEIKEESPDQEIYKSYFGGIGTGVRYLYDNQPEKVDPLGPENILGFVPGLLNGTNFPFSGRYTIVGKSPLTGTWGDSNSGGYFGPELKNAGFDAVFIKGISDNPVYLWIKDGKVELRDANHLWGKDSYETEKNIKKELGDDRVRVASIGPSGEKLSLISGIANDMGRIAARSGLGAVMGSKKLKAVAVRGTGKIHIYDEEIFRELRKQAIEPMKLKPRKLTKIMMFLFKPLMGWMLRKGKFSMSDTGVMVEGFGTHGTTMLMSASSEMGDAPVKNWKGSGAKDFPMKKASYKISDDNITKYKVKKYNCQACPLGCGAILKIDEGLYKLEETHRPEYETLAAFGSMSLNDNAESIIMANDICNRYGLDTISAGATIAFAIELFEENIITKDDTDGIELTWGNSEAIIEMLKKLANREGFGDILADGVKVASEKIGKGSEKYAMHVLGQELSMHDPRLNPSFGTTYVTDPTPARHTQGGAGFQEFGFSINAIEGLNLPEIERYEYKNKGKAHALTSIAIIIQDSVGICEFSGMFGKAPYVKILNAATGWKFTLEELMKAGERIQTLRQVFNVREGIKPSDMKLPDRVKGIPPLSTGATANITIDIDSMVEAFYKVMDWNLKDGKPSEEKLRELGLTKAIADLY